MALDLNKLESSLYLHDPNMLCVSLAEKLWGYREEIKKVKSLRVDGQADGG